MRLKRLSTRNHVCSRKYPSMFEFIVNRMVRGYKSRLIITTIESREFRREIK